MSALGEYDRCNVCGEFGWANRHTCPPLYQCRMVNDSDDLEWSRINAVDSETAAEKFVRRWFWDGGYECFKDGERVTVEVRQREGGDIEIFEVLGEQTMEFHASDGDKDDAIEDAEKEAAKALAVALVSIQLLAWRSPENRKYILDWSLRSAIRRAEFHFQHLCELRGLDPDDDPSIPAPTDCMKAGE